MCPACNLDLKAPIFMRTRASSGCPNCSGASRVKQSQPTILEAQPACLAEWDYEHNHAEGIYPDNTTIGSNKLVHWICSCCPKGQHHRWTAMPNTRIQKGVGCAVCGGRQACVCNSLESLFPLIAVEFDVDKNAFAPSEITPRSNKKTWCRNAKRGSWMQMPNHRTDRRHELYMQQAGV